MAIGKARKQLLELGLRDLAASALQASKVCQHKVAAQPDGRGRKHGHEMDVLCARAALRRTCCE